MHSLRNILELEKLETALDLGFYIGGSPLFIEPEFNRLIVEPLLPGSNCLPQSWHVVAC